MLTGGRHCCSSGGHGIESLCRIYPRLDRTCFSTMEVYTTDEMKVVYFFLSRCQITSVNPSALLWTRSEADSNMLCKCLRTALGKICT